MERGKRQTERRVAWLLVGVANGQTDVMARQNGHKTQGYGYGDCGQTLALCDLPVFMERSVYVLVIGEERM